MNEPRVVIYSRRDCHLCDVAEQVVEAVCAETGDEYVVVDIDQYPELRDLYTNDVPVIGVDGRAVSRWRISPDMLRAALTQPAQ